MRDVLTGAVTGGLGSAWFYGAGKAVEKLRGSVAGRGSGEIPVSGRRNLGDDSLYCQRR